MPAQGWNCQVVSCTAVVQATVQSKEEKGEQVPEGSLISLRDLPDPEVTSRDLPGGRGLPESR